MKPTFLALASVVACAVFAGAVPLANLAWNLPPTARIEGETLAVEVPPGDGNVRAEAYAHCTAELDLSEILDAGLGAAVSVRVRAVGVSEPDAPWNGVKFMLRYVEEDTGETRWPGVKLPRGTFDWTNATVRLNRLAAPVPPAGGRVTLVLGLQGCTGRAEFDLTSLVLSAEPSGLEPVNQNYIVRYPDDDSDNRRPTTDNPPLRGNLLQGPSGLAGSPQPGGRRGAPLCGCMLPGRATTEDDIETLHRWGATLARFQIMRNWFMDNDCQDLDEYARWIDSRLDNLEDVLRWAAARGMKICVDLHSPPGGKRPGDRAMNMFFEEKYADAFVETWKRIAARCAPILQTTGPVIYGYDLVNEPVQKEAAPFGYWELQRRAAEAVRAIDPVTPVIVESNLSAAPSAFRYLSPLAMDNVIYQIHLYKPHDYTHQGIQGVPVGAVWPDPGKGRDRDFLRRALEPVRDFQRRHGARIYVGEFSAASRAPGAENYLRDCISLFEEYGWDWTYHAFRESPVWDVEKEFDASGKYVPSPDTPRKRALLDGFSASKVDHQTCRTDWYMDQLAEAGTEPFFRLGQKIEHWPKKYGIHPPPDFKKWAVICEHVIRHLNEGWAGGAQSARHGRLDGALPRRDGEPPGRPRPDGFLLVAHLRHESRVDGRNRPPRPRVRILDARRDLADVPAHLAPEGARRLRLPPLSAALVEW